MPNLSQLQTDSNTLPTQLPMCIYQDASDYFLAVLSKYSGTKRKQSFWFEHRLRFWNIQRKIDIGERIREMVIWKRKIGTCNARKNLYVQQQSLAMFSCWYIWFDIVTCIHLLQAIRKLLCLSVLWGGELCWIVFITTLNSVVVDADLESPSSFESWLVCSRGVSIFSGELGC